MEGLSVTAPLKQYAVKHKTMHTYISEGQYITASPKLASRWPTRESADIARQEITQEFAGKWEVVEAPNAET